MTSLVEIYRRFPTREAAVAHLIRTRWPDGPICPACGAATVATKAEVEAKTASRYTQEDALRDRALQDARMNAIIQEIRRKH